MSFASVEEAHMRAVSAVSSYYEKKQSGIESDIKTLRSIEGVLMQAETAYMAWNTADLLNAKAKGMSEGAARYLDQHFSQYIISELREVLKEISSERKKVEKTARN
jgi:hypothetical protein